MTTRVRKAAMVVAGALALLLLTAATAFAATDTVEPEPVLMLRGFKSTPATLSVGAKFKLEVYLDNVVDVDAENVVVTLGLSAASSSASSTTGSTGNGPQVVVLGTNTRFLGTLAGNVKNRAVSFDLMSTPQSAPGPCSVPVTIEFDDPNGGRATSVQTVGLTFTRTLVFDVGALTYPRETTAGAPFHVSVNVQNTNDFAVHGVVLSFDASGTDWVSRETTVGTLEPGATGRLEGTGIAQTPGLLTVTMTLTYKDDFDVTKRITRDFVISVSAKPATPPAQEVPRSTGRQIVLFLRALLGLGG